MFFPAGVASLGFFSPFSDWLRSLIQVAAEKRPDFWHEAVLTEKHNRLQRNETYSQWIPHFWWISHWESDKSSQRCPSRRHREPGFCPVISVCETCDESRRLHPTLTGCLVQENWVKVSPQGVPMSSFQVNFLLRTAPVAAPQPSTSRWPSVSETPGLVLDLPSGNLTVCYANWPVSSVIYRFKTGDSP